jgi:hypothetical protein
LQYEKLDYKQKYQFLNDLFDAIYPVVLKHFKADAFGSMDDIDDQAIFVELDNALQDYEDALWADTELRNQFLENVPFGYTKKKIKNMTPWELLDLDRYLQWAKEDAEEETRLRREKDDKK